VTSSKLLIAREGSLMRLTLNRPDRGNALDQELADELLEAVSECDGDSRVRCVMLTGSGRLFCAGGDITAFAEDTQRMPQALRKLAGTLHESVIRLGNMRKPLLTLVNGPAAGAGMSLAIMGDVVLCARSAHFTAAYGAIGLTPDGGMTWSLPRLIGMRKAQELVFTNRRVPAAEAEQIGLVTRVVDDAALAEEGAKVAETLSRSAIAALATARTLLANSYSAALASQLESEARTIAAMSREPECREGIAAFRDKRKPDFH
jgi:2-(1,2-epoxy-1,2-dihydrophenyl)acetyl-CoA isomerase